MAKKILVFPEYWLPHTFNLIRGFSDLNDPGIEVYWSNKKWHRKEFGEFSHVCQLELHDAMKRLNDGFFDALVVSDGTTIGYLTNHLAEGTKRVFLDTSDTKYVNKSYLYFSDIYLKCQHPQGLPLVGDQTCLEEYSTKVSTFPFPYCTTYPIDDRDIVHKKRDRVVHFRGWVGTNDRRLRVMEALRSSGIEVRGGLYKREEFPINFEIPDDMKSEKVSYKEYLKEMQSCQIAINIPGNGEMCFRTYEIWRCGICMVSQNINIRFPGKPPVHGQDWVLCKGPKEIAEACGSLLDSPTVCDRIGANGSVYWSQYCSPSFCAKRFKNIVFDGELDE